MVTIPRWQFALRLLLPGLWLGLLLCIALVATPARSTRTLIWRVCGMPLYWPLRAPIVTVPVLSS